MGDLKAHIAKVAAGAPLAFNEAREAFDIIMSGEATPGQIGGFLMALRVRGETVDEIAGAVATMRAKMLRVEAPAGAIDIVGTGRKTCAAATPPSTPLQCAPCLPARRAPIATRC